MIGEFIKNCYTVNQRFLRKVHSEMPELYFLITKRLCKNIWKKLVVMRHGQRGGVANNDAIKRKATTFTNNGKMAESRLGGKKHYNK